MSDKHKKLRSNLAEIFALMREVDIEFERNGHPAWLVHNATGISIDAAELGMPPNKSEGDQRAAIDWADKLYPY